MNLRLAGLVPLVLLAGASAAAGHTERLVVISNDEPVGELTAKIDGRDVAIDYDVDNNGRGPTIHERLVLDERGRPVEWRITGESSFGAAVDEHYRWTDGEACWQSQADRGCEQRAERPLYIENDGSPWALGLYARALRAAPDRSLAVLPAGKISLSVLDRISVGDAGVTIYALKGLNLSPQVIALDEADRLFAVLSGRGVTIREGYEAHQAALRDKVRAIEADEREAMHARLKHHFDSPVRIDDVHVFDPVKGTRGEPTSVTVVDGVIRSVGGSAQGAAVVVDGEGGTLVPGLYDMHAHNGFDSLLFHLAAGVTSTRDMGNEPALLRNIMQQIGDGELAGPRITPAGLIEARTPYSVRIGIVADTLDDALEAVRWYAGHGYHEIKIYNSMIPEWVSPLIAEAGRHGLGVSGHVPAFTTPDDMITAGYDSIAHLNQLMLGWLLEPGEDTRTPLRLTGMKRAHDLDLDRPDVRRTIGLLTRHGVAVDTTAIILERLMLSRAGSVQPGDRPYLDHMPIGYQRYRRRTFVPLESSGDSAEYEKAFESVLATIGLLHGEGVELLIGTDDGTGFSVHRELELYVDAGIPPATTLGIASLGAARYLGQEDRLGRIEPGFLADFFLVPGDPTKNIRDIREVRLVAAGGGWYFPEEIFDALGIEPFATRPAIAHAGLEKAGETKAGPPGPFDPTRIDDSPPAGPVRTSHAGEFNGRRIEYEVLTGETVMEDGDGRPAATIFSTAYLRKGADPKTRPIVFVFNGGPGASSSPLHLGVGPVRRAPSDPDAPLVPNEHSPLDAVDLVFMDPVGTGFTRLFYEGAGKAFWGVLEDADANLEYIGRWLVENERTESPLFFMGESYGGTRVAVMLARAGDLKIDGALLLSPAIDFSAQAPVVGNNLPYVFLMPSMAATAVYHGVRQANGARYRDVFEQAASFALSDYTAALYQGNLQPDDERRGMAQALSDRIGLEVDYLLEQNLRVSSSEFWDRLLADRGLRVGRLDARITGPAAELEDERPPYNDPSMAGGEGGRSTGDLLMEYFREVLDTPIERYYRTLNLDANSNWNFRQQAQGPQFYFSVLPSIEQAMKADPALEVWVGGGLFDMATPVMASRYFIAQLPIPRERFSFAVYEAGHSVFDHEESRAALGRDLRAFVTGRVSDEE